MNKILITIAISVVLILIGVLTYQTFLSYKGMLEDQTNEEPIEEEGEEEEEPFDEAQGGEELVYLEPARALSEKSIIIVVAPEDLQKEEYLKIRQIFWAAGAKAETASTSEDLNLDDFDAVVFIEEETTAVIGKELVNIKDSTGPEDFAMRVVEILALQ